MAYYKFTQTGAQIQKVLDDVEEIQNDSGRTSELTGNSLASWIKYFINTSGGKIDHIRLEGATTDLEIIEKRVVIPPQTTSINGLSGGELTSPLILSGGDSATAHKIRLAVDGQITANGANETATLFGRNSESNLLVGHNSHSLSLRGKNERPTYNTNSYLALLSDVPTESTISGWGFTKNVGTITTIKVGNTSYRPSDSGTVSLPEYPSVPTKVSELTNDSGFVDEDDVKNNLQKYNMEITEGTLTITTNY